MGVDKSGQVSCALQSVENGTHRELHTQPGSTCRGEMALRCRQQPGHAERWEGRLWNGGELAWEDGPRPEYRGPCGSG